MFPPELRELLQEELPLDFLLPDLEVESIVSPLVLPDTVRKLPILRVLVRVLLDARVVSEEELGEELLDFFISTVFTELSLRDEVSESVEPVSVLESVTQRVVSLYTEMEVLPPPVDFMDTLFDPIIFLSLELESTDEELSAKLSEVLELPDGILCKL